MLKKVKIIICLLSLFSVSYAQSDDKEPIVIVSSYNPDVRNISENIDNFAEKIAEEKIQNPLKVENMNCRNLSECMQWKDRLHDIIDKYYQGGHRPAALILFGAEASTTFFSIDDSLYRKTPVLVGMRSNNIVHLPDSDNVDLKTWNPKVYYLDKDYDSYNIVGGMVYSYDVNRNIDLISHIYPKVDSLLFLSDNTLGGVTMRSHFFACMRAHHDYKIKALDGRLLSFAEVDNELSQVSGNKAVIIGTWRIDNTDSYAIANATYAFGQSNPDLPAFTLSTVGMGHWAIGGYTPHYQTSGAEIAEAVANYLRTGKKEEIRFANQEYTFDYTKLQQFNIDESVLPQKRVLLNEPVSFFKENIYIFLGFFLVVLVLAVLVSYQRTEILERKRLQKQLEKRGTELEEAYAKAEKANALKTDFIANMSHEIRTPLNAIVGFAQLLSEPDIEISREEKATYRSYLTSNSDLLLDLINDILDLSKLDSNKFKFVKTTVDMCELCRISVASAKTTTNPSVEIIADVPESPIFVQTDKLRIEQVVGNLLTNAKKFTDKGTITVSLTKTNNDEICVEVKDTGAGIPSEKAEKVFERFAKLDAYKQGTGLGLSICQNFVERLGGRIWLDTSYTNGASFKFTLPA